MSKHTPEPWQAHQDASGDVFISSAATSFHIAEIGSEDDDTAIPDARRIVACVNACKGVDTDLLEAGELDKPTMLVMQENKDLKRRCDELLAALEGLLADMHLRAKLDGDVDSDGCVVLNCGSSVLHAAHSAIAKAKGV